MCEVMQTIHLTMGKQKNLGSALRIYVSEGGRLTVQQRPYLDTNGAITVTPDGTVKNLFPAALYGPGDFAQSDYLLAVGGPYRILQKPLLPAIDSTVCIIRDDQDNPDLTFNPIATNISVLLGHNPGGEPLRGTVIFIPFNEL